MKNKYIQKPKDKLTTYNARTAASFGAIITGNFLNKTEVVQQLPFIFFVCFLLMTYLIYDFKVEKKLMEIHLLEKEVQQLQLKQITVHAELSKEQLYSRIVQKLQKNDQFFQINLRRSCRSLVDGDEQQDWPK